MRSLHREEREQSRRHPRHFPCKVSVLHCHSLHIASVVMCVHVDLSALLQYATTKKNCSSSSRAVTYFQRLSSGSPTSCTHTVTLEPGRGGRADCAIYADTVSGSNSTSWERPYLRVCIFVKGHPHLHFFYIRLFIFPAALPQTLPYMRASQLSQPLCKMQALVEL